MKYVHFFDIIEKGWWTYWADILILMAEGQTQQAIERSKEYADSFGKYELEIERYFDHSLSCRVLELITRKPAGIILD